jgi:16S rRNA (guanine966-N2)-methyltransferase
VVIVQKSLICSKNLMRFIPGQARGHPLKAPKGSTTRPTADKIKGAIFSMLESLMMAQESELEPPLSEELESELVSDESEVETQSLWEGLNVLDLFAGSGALAIEALSRGAAWADLVEADSAVCKTIRDNLVYTKLVSKARVHCLPVRKALSEIYREQLKAPFDVVLLDPPYADPKIGEVLNTLANPWFIKPSGLMVVEHSRRVDLPDRFQALRLVKARRHGDTMVSIYSSEPA